MRPKNLMTSTDPAAIGSRDASLATMRGVALDTPPMQTRSRSNSAATGSLTPTGSGHVRRTALGSGGTEYRRIGTTNCSPGRVFLVRGAGSPSRTESRSMSTTTTHAAPESPPVDSAFEDCFVTPATSPSAWSGTTPSASVGWPTTWRAQLRGRPDVVYCAAHRGNTVKSTGKSKVCRRCRTETWDYDAVEDEWFCDTCDDWADV